MVLVGTLGFRPRRAALPAADRPALPPGLGDALLDLAAAAAELRAALLALAEVGRANLRVDAHVDPDARLPLWRRLNDAGHRGALDAALAARDRLLACARALDPGERHLLAAELAALASLDALGPDLDPRALAPRIDRALHDLRALERRLAARPAPAYR